MTSKKSKEEEIESTVGSYVDKGREAVMEGAKSAEEAYTEAVAQVSKLVRKHPMEALAIGFGVGCVVGLLISRR